MSFSSRIIKKSIALFTLIIIGFLFACTADAATITVNNGTSTVAVDASCSIREAIENANDNAATNVDCTAGSGTDTLDIQTDIALTLLDHSGAFSDFAVPSIMEAVVIQGNGHTIARSGVTSFGFGDFSAAVTLSEITMNNFSQNVFEGDGPLTIEDSTFSENADSVAYTNFGGSAHPWVITDSVFTDNTSTDHGVITKEDGGTLTISGAIFSDNTNSGTSDGSAVRYLNGNSSEVVSVSDSVFENNVYTVGGCGAFGVSASQDVNIEIDNTVFDSNTSEACGGGVSVESGFAFATISLEITNSLFKNNVAWGTGVSAKSGGAMYVQNGMNLTLTNNTFFGNSSQVNGGAIQIHNEAGVIAIEAKHNTFYGNSSADGDGNDIYIETGAGDTSVFENNIFASGGDECGGDLSSFTFTNNLSSDVDCGGTPATSLASALAMNGAGIETLALQATSNAINTGIAGTLGCPATDARGVARPSGSGCDIGAYEFVNSPPTDISLSDSSIDEGKDIGEIVAAMTATDSNTGDTHNYSLGCTVAGVDDGYFSISSDNLVTQEVFDYSDRNSYLICIRATDNAGATYDKNFTISISERSGGSGGSGGGPSSPPTPPSDTPPTPPVDPVPEPKPDIPPAPEPEPEPESEPDPIPEPPTTPGPTNDVPEEGITPSDNSAPYPITDVESKFENFSDIASYVLGSAIEEIPEGTVETVSVVGVTLPAVAFIATQPAMAANLATLPIRLWNLVPIWLGLRRKKRPWGTVYDSVTKQPLDPVYVSLYSLSHKEVATTITDLDGRFGFLVPPGRYKISARKDSYEFPSKRLAGKETDDLYGGLYDGSEINITGEESLVIKNIPMDSTSFNWNEFEKAKNKKLMKFYSKRDVLMARVAEIAFWAGFVCSLIVLYAGPSKLNYILSAVYLVVLILRFLGVKPKRPGYVVETGTGFPLSFGILKIYSKALKKEIAHAVIGKTGKYYVLVPNGEYYVKIEKKIGEDRYEEVGTSDSFIVKKGFIGRNFKV